MLPCEGSGTASTVSSESVLACTELYALTAFVTYEAGIYPATLLHHISPVSDSDSVCSVLVSLVAPEALVKILLSPFGTL